MRHLVSFSTVLLVVAAAAQTAGAQSYTCGDQQISVVVEKGRARVTVGGQALLMNQVPAASGAKYEVAGDTATSFWSRGRSATLVVKGKSYPECTQSVAPPSAAKFTARGNEPGWTLTLAGSDLALMTDMGASKINTRIKEEAATAGRKLTGSILGRPLVVTLADQICRDSMTGMPYPQSVEITLGDSVPLKGCGGLPGSLLAGNPWTVQQIGGAAPVEGARVSMQFGNDGRVAGQTSCNNFTGKYAIGGEGIRIGPVASTRKACRPELMNQEQQFLMALSAVTRFDVGADGQLTLFAGDTARLVAAR
jgi:heat shock protein HslJ/membrane-bound inhibitor of C-type lysozyme